ncbi:hypothetical protein BH11GEM2_BH11GEM2_33730 [soil metagenome]
MTSIGVAELKAKLSEYLRAVRKGQEVTVMDRDQPIARIVPIHGAGALTIREPRSAYGALANVPLPPPAALRVDAVALLLEDRRGDE